MFVLTLALGASRHSPVAGLVSHTSTAPSMFTEAAALTDTVSAAPTLDVAREKKPNWRSWAMLAMPSPLGVSAMAITSATGVLLAASSSVLMPAVTGAVPVLPQVKLNSMSLALKAWFGVMLSRKDWLPPAAMSAGVFGEPVRALLAASVVW